MARVMWQTPYLGRTGTLHEEMRLCSLVVVLLSIHGAAALVVPAHPLRTRPAVAVRMEEAEEAVELTPEEKASYDAAVDYERRYRQAIADQAVARQASYSSLPTKIAGVLLTVGAIAFSLNALDPTVCSILQQTKPGCS